MARRLVVISLLMVLTMAVSAEYKIYLSNGKVINADDKPLVQNGIAYFQKQGMELYLPVDQIDMAKTEAGGPAMTQQSTTAEPKPKAVLRINDDQLQKISQHSRLANEGELDKAEYPTENQGEGTPAPTNAPTGAQGRDALQNQVADMVSQRADLQKQMLDLQAQLNDLRSKDATSTNLTDKNAAQQQMSAVQSQLDGVRGQLSSLDGQIQNAQQKLSSMPVVVQAQ